MRPYQSWSRSMVGRRIRATPAKPTSTVAIRRGVTPPAPRDPSAATALPSRKSAIHTDDM